MNVEISCGVKLCWIIQPRKLKLFKCNMSVKTLILLLLEWWVLHHASSSKHFPAYFQISIGFSIMIQFEKRIWGGVPSFFMYCAHFTTISLIIKEARKAAEPFLYQKPFQSVSDLLANVEIHYPKMDFYLTVFQSFLHRNSSGIWHPKSSWM